MTCAALLTACGSTSGGANTGDSSKGLPSTITLPSIMEMTGSLAAFGKASTQGEQTAVDEINQTKFLGHTKLALKISDTTGSATQAASLTQQAISGGAPIILGSVDSTMAIVEAPIAQRAKVPMVYLSSSGDIAKIGNYIYGATADSTQYFHWEMDYLKAKSANNIGIIYDSDAPSEQELAQQVSALAAEDNIKVSQKIAVTSTTNDTSSQVAKLLSSKPKAVVVLVLAVQNVTLVSQIRQAGYTGIIAGSLGMGTGTLDSVGPAANGVVWATSFSAYLNTPTAKDFTTRYRALYGTVPNNTAADGYNQIWFVARALKAAGSDSRSAILKGLQETAAQGYPGVGGEVKYNSDRGPIEAGMLIQFEDKKELPVKGFGS